MKVRICRFLSSTVGLYSAVGITIGAVQPVDWWWKLLGIAILTPVLVAATSKFFGVYQLWDWHCDESRSAE